MNSATSPKLVYLDVCVLCRPFDNQNQVRIRLETSAVELILTYIRSSKLEFIVSPTHELEIRAIHNRGERHELFLLLKQIGTPYQFHLLATRRRAEELVALGLGVADAAHLAFAEQAGAEFVTVDDRLLRKCRTQSVKPSVWCTAILLREGGFKMNMIRYLPEDQLIERGLSALMQALGPIETRRFLNLPHSQRLESVQRHHQWQDTLTQEYFFDAIFGPANDSLHEKG